MDAQVENLRRKFIYFAMMICCCYWSTVLQGNLRTGGEPKEKLFLLCDDDPLLQTDASPSNKLMDRSTTQGETVVTLQWWSVAATGAESFKQIDGQVENRRTKCFYFRMMICCCKQMWVLQGHLGTGRQPKEKIFILWADDLLLKIDASPSKKLIDRSRTEGDPVSTLRWWTVSANRAESLSKLNEFSITKRIPHCDDLLVVIDLCPLFTDGNRL